MTIDALIIFQDEFKQRNFLDWLISHISGFFPPHRHKGIIEITSEFLKFTGIDTKLKTESEFFIIKDRIEEVFHGYDDTYNATETRSLGLGWAPVRIKFNDNKGQEIFVYIITGNNNYWGSTNKEFYNFLTGWLY